MSRNRPRQKIARSARRSSKSEPGYWFSRVFRSTYSYKGRTLQVRNWTVKIQHRRKRKTFTLSSVHRRQAAAEACRIYRALIKKHPGAPPDVLPAFPQIDFERHSNPASGEDRSNIKFWAQRLIHRDYTARFPGEVRAELSVRMDHEGTSQYFPLGTSDQKLAASRALEIYRCVVTSGWEVVNQRFRREVTLAFHWLDSPLAWTYTTIITQPDAGSDAVPAGPDARFEIAIVESDAGIRNEMASCVNLMPGFRCAAVFAEAAEALRELPRNHVELVLASRNLRDKPGGVLVEELKTVAPRVPAMVYSVYEDSEELFKTTPGGVPLYLLRRTPASRLLEPIVAVLQQGNLLTEGIAPGALQYFKNTLVGLPIEGVKSQLANLTPREQEVLGLLSKGYADKEIAARLGISIYTVHEHVRNTFEKLGVHNRIEAVVKFLQK